MSRRRTRTPSISFSLNVAMKKKKYEVKLGRLHGGMKRSFDTCQICGKGKGSKTCPNCSRAVCWSCAGKTLRSNRMLLCECGTPIHETDYNLRSPLQADEPMVPPSSCPNGTLVNSCFFRPKGKSNEGPLDIEAVQMMDYDRDMERSHPIFAGRIPECAPSEFSKSLQWMYCKHNVRTYITYQLTHEETAALKNFNTIITDVRGAEGAKDGNYLSLEAKSHTFDVHVTSGTFTVTVSHLGSTEGKDITIPKEKLQGATSDLKFRVEVLEKIKFLKRKLPDYAAHTVDDFLWLFEQLHESSGAVYMHCSAGMGRSGFMVMAAILYDWITSYNYAPNLQTIAYAFAYGYGPAAFREVFENTKLCEARLRNLRAALIIQFAKFGKRLSLYDLSTLEGYTSEAVLQRLHHLSDDVKSRSDEFDGRTKENFENLFADSEPKIGRYFDVDIRQILNHGKEATADWCTNLHGTTRQACTSQMRDAQGKDKDILDLPTDAPKETEMDDWMDVDDDGMEAYVRDNLEKIVENEGWVKHILAFYADAASGIPTVTHLRLTDEMEFGGVALTPLLLREAAWRGLSKEQLKAQTFYGQLYDLRGRRFEPYDSKLNTTMHIPEDASTYQVPSNPREQTLLKTSFKLSIGQYRVYEFTTETKRSGLVLVEDDDETFTVSMVQCRRSSHYFDFFVSGQVNISVDTFSRADIDFKLLETFNFLQVFQVECGNQTMKVVNYPENCFFPDRTVTLALR